VTLDAMHWVWTHATVRGNARLVLLAVADAATDETATARMGTTEFMRRLGVPTKSTALAAVAAALKSGELVIEVAAAGSRAARYRLPGAVGYSRVSGLNPRPERDLEGGSGFQTAKDLRSESQTANGSASGLNPRPERDLPESGLRSESQTACGLKSRPHHAPNEGVQEGGKESAPAPGIPDFARPLVDTITRAGHTSIRWSLTPAEWLTIHALIKTTGTDTLARFATEQAARRRVAHARYFLPGWRELAPAPAPATGTVTPGSTVVPFTQPPRRSRAQRTADELAQLLAQENRP
jgi:hypothetical protein